MPYTISQTEKDGKPEWCVYKVGADEKPEGETLGCHDTKDKAVAQIGAIESSEKEPERIDCPAPLPRYMRAYAERADNTPDDAPVRFVASTEGVKRDGLDLKAGDWQLDNFMRHPVVLWAHDYMNRLPLGTGAPAWDGSRLLMDVNFDKGDTFAQEVKRKARLGMVAGSVGWNDLAEGKRELMEFSIVPVPADPEALPVRARQAWLAYERATNGVGVGAVSQLGVSLPGSAADSATATKWVTYSVPITGQEVNVSDARYSVSDKRYGVVMSKRNLDDLEQAITLIQGVIARAKKEEEQQPDEKPEPERGDAPIMAALAEIQARIAKLTEVNHG